jgi:2-polyprenyl-3-methyl-5-hydroxy-6-metoxy-1,4-benzoquinol methylase
LSNFERDHIINQPWPEADLEYLGSCPLCGSVQRTLLYEGLRDRVFYCAPGSWTLHRCSGCYSAYLDPRPIPESMDRAYELYYTHETEDREEPENLLKRIKQVVKNGYLNRKWKTALSPASQILGMLLPKSKKAFFDERVMRHLRRPSGGRALLDVGCGNGQFLALASSAGWRVTGFDIDQKAVNKARSRGLVDVRLGGFETVQQASDCFDAITVSHVIEHVYNPKELIANCYRLLNPGGYFWIETPNINSFGHSKFKGDWRGLEPPRHLQLLSWNLLKVMLYEAGFNHVAPASWCPIYLSMNCASKAIKFNDEPRKMKPTYSDIIKNLFIELRNRGDHTRREFITFQATK